jgi:uracil permease
LNLEFENQRILPMSSLRYTLEERPPALRNVLYAVQWLLIVLPLVTITSNLMAGFLGMDELASTALFQRFLMVTGTVTVIQCLAGHRYPLLDGPSAALLLSVAVLAGHGPGVVAGGMIAGAVVLAVLGGAGLVGKLQPLFTDRVVGVVLLLISTTFLPFLYPMIIGVSPARPTGDPAVLILAVLIMVVIILISYWGKGLVKNLSIFIGILIGYLAMAGMRRVILPPLEDLSWITLPDPFFVEGMHFTFPATLSFLLAYLAVLINGLGSYYSVAEVVGKEGLQKRIERGIALTGIGGVGAAALGVVGTVSYSLSPGVILVTRVGSRSPVILCGVLLLALGLFQKMAAVLASIPNAVVGAALLVTLAAQMGVGISVVVGPEKKMEIREYFVVGMPLLLGTAASMIPREYLAVFGHSTGALIGNGLIVGIVAVLVLEHVVLRDKNSKFQISNFKSEKKKKR